MNPYRGAHFFDFFLLLAQRVRGFVDGRLSVSDLALDEIQILVLCMVAISASLVGCFLVLRRMTMLANSLSHTILLGIVITYLLSYSGGANPWEESINVQRMLIAALATGMATTFATEFLSKVVGLQEDASTGLVFTSLFALGIVLLTLFSRNAHIGAEVVMGNADALSPGDIRLVAWILGLNLLSFIIFYKEFKLTTFDGSLARVLGVSSVFFNYLLMAQVSATVIGAFRAVGVVMVLCMITGPVLTARMWTHRLQPLLALAALAGVTASLAGVALSRHILSTYHIALSTSGLVVCVMVAMYLFTLVFSPEQGLLHRLRYSKQLRAKA